MVGPVFVSARARDSDGQVFRIVEPSDFHAQEQRRVDVAVSENIVIFGHLNVPSPVGDIDGNGPVVAVVTDGIATQDVNIRSAGNGETVGLGVLSTDGIEPSERPHEASEQRENGHRRRGDDFEGFLSSLRFRHGGKKASRLFFSGNWLS